MTEKLDEKIDLIQEADRSWGFEDFPGGPVVETPCFPCEGVGSIPGWGTRRAHAEWHGQKKSKSFLPELKPQRYR